MTITAYTEKPGKRHGMLFAAVLYVHGRNGPRSRPVTRRELERALRWPNGKAVPVLDQAVSAGYLLGSLRQLGRARHHTVMYYTVTEQGCALIEGDYRRYLAALGVD